MKSSTLVIVLVVLAVLLLCCCSVAAIWAFNTYSGQGGVLFRGWSAFGQGSWEATRDFGRDVQVGVPAVVTVINEVGDINVRAGEGGMVSVQAQARARAADREAADRLLEQVRLDVSSSGNQAEIRVQVPTNLLNQSLSVRLDITVPRSSTLTVQNNVGDITIEDLDGAVVVIGDVGDVTLRRVTLAGDSEIRSEVGEVTFEGSLPEVGEMNISSDVGSVTVRLPAESQFLLDAATDVGDITVVGFEVQDQETGGERGVESSLRGRVGQSPQATLTVRTATGGIRIESR
ncbi:MAG: DUF4097 family beta strand repeat-containing protein [Anaerolineae bacterium]|jgi:hypothetical protein